MALPAMLVYSHPVIDSPVSQGEPMMVCRITQEATLPLKSPVSAAPAPLYMLDDDGITWTSSPGVSAAVDRSSYVEGGSSDVFAIKREFSSGPVAFRAIDAGDEAPDLTGCDLITLWIKTDTYIADGVLLLQLCENDNGTGSCKVLPIPGTIIGGNDWQKVTMKLSGDSEHYDAVSSIALCADSDPGQAIIWLDAIELWRETNGQSPDRVHLNTIVSPRIQEVLLAG